MADSRFKGTRGVRFGDVGESAVVEEIKAQMKQGKTFQQAVDAVSVKRRAPMREILKIAERHGLKSTT